MVRDVVTYGVLGAVLFLFLSGVVLIDDGSFLSWTGAGWAQGAFYFFASPLGAPPPGSEADLIPQGLILAFLVFAVLGFLVHCVKS